MPQTPSPQPPDSGLLALRLVSMLLLVLDIALIGLLAVVVTVWLPSFRNVFNDFHTTLPALTILHLTIPPVLGAAGLGLLLAGLVGKEMLSGRHAPKAIINGVVLVGLVLILISSFVAVQLPLLKLTASVSGS